MVMVGKKRARNSVLVATAGAALFGTTACGSETPWIGPNDNIDDNAQTVTTAFTGWRIITQLQPGEKVVCGPKGHRLVITGGERNTILSRESDRKLKDAVNIPAISAVNWTWIPLHDDKGENVATAYVITTGGSKDDPGTPFMRDVVPDANYAVADKAPCKGLNEKSYNTSVHGRLHAEEHGDLYRSWAGANVKARDRFFDNKSISADLSRMQRWVIEHANTTPDYTPPRGRDRVGHQTLEWVRRATGIDF